MGSSSSSWLPQVRHAASGACVVFAAVVFGKRRHTHTRAQELTCWQPQLLGLVGACVVLEVVDPLAAPSLDNLAITTLARPAAADTVGVCVHQERLGCCCCCCASLEGVGKWASETQAAAEVGQQVCCGWLCSKRVKLQLQFIPDCDDGLVKNLVGFLDLCGVTQHTSVSSRHHPGSAAWGLRAQAATHEQYTTTVQHSPSTGPFCVRAA